jgi:hypothetical protein
VRSGPSLLTRLKLFNQGDRNIVSIRGRAGIKLLFAAVFLWQLLQLGIARKYGELYPGLVMPAFAGTMVDRNGNIRLTDVKCTVSFRDGHLEWLSAQELLPETPDSNRLPIMVHMFSPPPTLADKWPADTLKGRLLRGRALARARHTQKELDPETMGWLKTRVEAIYPGQEAASVTFIWYDSIFSAERVSLVPVVETTGIREVQFR